MDATGKDETPRASVTGAVRRRGLIAGAAALVTGMIVARTAEQTAAAVGEPVLQGVVNPATGTLATSTAINGQTTRGTFYATNSATGAAYAGLFDQTRDGTQGYATTTGNAGVSGRNDDLDGLGVVGIGSNGIGVYGQTGGGAAISASATSGYGVFSNTASGISIYGTTANGVYGVFGTTGRPGGAGVFGVSNTGYGVLGQTSANNGYSGVFGVASAPNTIAVHGASVPGATAGFFNGPVVVQGNFTVTGAKSAGVKHPDGSTRRLYCVEAPEAYFEDYGEGKLVAGRGQVELDPDFAALVKADTYQVFLTEQDDHHHLTVKRKRGNGFAVEADEQVAAMKGRKMADLNGTFNYRVVAKRKDAVGGRLEKIEMPNAKAAPTLQLPQEPKVTRRPGK